MCCKLIDFRRNINIYCSFQYNWWLGTTIWSTMYKNNFKVREKILSPCFNSLIVGIIIDHFMIELTSAWIYGVFKKWFIYKMFICRIIQYLLSNLQWCRMKFVDMYRFHSLRLFQQQKMKTHSNRIDISDY